MTVKKSGGKRSGSGRKPIKDKKMQLFIYPPGSHVKSLGRATARRIALAAIADAAFLKQQERHEKNK